LDFAAGAETLEVRLFSEQQVPWDQLAFATIKNTLIHYYRDRKAGEFNFHMGTIKPSVPGASEPMKSAAG
jgi:hypothetical protein